MDTAGIALLRKRTLLQTYLLPSNESHSCTVGIYYCWYILFASPVFSTCCLPQSLVSVGLRPLVFLLCSALGEPCQETGGRREGGQGSYCPAASLLGCPLRAGFAEFSPEFLYPFPPLLLPSRGSSSLAVASRVRIVY